MPLPFPPSLRPRPVGQAPPWLTCCRVLTPALPTLRCRNEGLRVATSAPPLGVSALALLQCVPSATSALGSPARPGPAAAAGMAGEQLRTASPNERHRWQGSPYSGPGLLTESCVRRYVTAAPPGPLGFRNASLTCTRILRCCCFSGALLPSCPHPPAFRHTTAAPQLGTSSRTSAPCHGEQDISEPCAQPLPPWASLGNKHLAAALLPHLRTPPATPCGLT